MYPSHNVDIVLLLYAAIDNIISEFCFWVSESGRITKPSVVWTTEIIISGSGTS